MFRKNILLATSSDSWIYSTPKLKPQFHLFNFWRLVKCNIKFDFRGTQRCCYIRVALSINCLYFCFIVPKDQTLPTVIMIGRQIFRMIWRWQKYIWCRRGTKGERLHVPHGISLVNVDGSEVMINKTSTRNQNVFRRIKSKQIGIETFSNV